MKPMPMPMPAPKDPAASRHRRAAGRVVAVALVAAAAGAWIAACGGAAPQKTMMSPAGATDAGGATGVEGRVTPHDQIQQLDDAIAADLATLGVPAPMPGDGGDAVLPMGHVVDACEAPPPAGTCGDVCTLADSICDNAGRICDLADDLPGDTWAAERCDAGKAACARASERCCGC